MRKELTTGEYQALAELRYRIRRFLREGDTVASEAGLEPQQYLLLLMIRGIPDGQEATVSNLAERLVLKHHSVVELIDRMEAHGYVRRSRSREDRRSVLVSLLPRGEKLLEQVAQHRVGELRASGAPRSFRHPEIICAGTAYLFPSAAPSSSGLWPDMVPNESAATAFRRPSRQF